MNRQNRPLARRLLYFTLAVLAPTILSCSVLAPEQAIAPLSVTVSEDQHFNQLFQRCGPGWTGGDSTFSTRLSPTQILWSFSDTFIGSVNREGKRNPTGDLFVQGNTLVLQDTTSGAMTTYVRETVGDARQIRRLPTFTESPYDSDRCPRDNAIQNISAEAMFQPPHCPSSHNCYYWSGAPVADDGELTIFLQLMEQTGSGIFDFAWRSSAMATVPLDALDTADPSYIDVPNNGVSYGGALLRTQDHYYIYGKRNEAPDNPHCSGHCIHIARAPLHQLAQPESWRYWGGESSDAGHEEWTDNAEDSVPMAGNTGAAAAPQTQDQLGIGRVSHCGALPQCYVLIAHQYTGGASDTLLAWYAAQPQGPWQGPVFVYQTPESKQPGQLFTYNTKVHPAFTNEEGLLVSYDVNSLAPFKNPLSAAVTANSYRPKFIRVKLHWGARENLESRAAPDSPSSILNSLGSRFRPATAKGET